MEYKTASSSTDIQWCFSQVKGTLDDDVTEGKYKITLPYNKTSLIVYMWLFLEFVLQSYFIAILIAHRSKL